MIVRSAVKEVSNTRRNPSRRSAATMIPSTSAPGFAPNASARLTETDGACWTTTNRAGSARASRTSSSALCSASAPVGQTTTHWPQLMQLRTLRPSSNAGPTCARLPRPMKSIAPTVWISSQTRTHLPQRMHLAGSRTIEGLATSSWCGVRAPK